MATFLEVRPEMSLNYTGFNNGIYVASADLLKREGERRLAHSSRLCTSNGTIKGIYY